MNDSDTKKTNYDVIIIGGGPSGVSAALYAARGGLDVLVLHTGVSALHRAERIQNYFGTGEISGAALYDAGIAQAESVGATVVKAQATFVAVDGQGFTVSTPNGDFRAHDLVLAVGATRKTAAVPGLTERKGVSYCAVCDAFFYRKKTVAVIGAGEYAKHEYSVLRAVAEKTYLFTNGQTPSFETDATVTAKIKGISGADGMTVEFDDGQKIDVDGIFVAIGVAGATDMAKSIGVMTDKSGAIKTDEFGMTNVSGLYAVGDCTNGIRQIAKAVNDGMNVGMRLLAKRK